MTADEIKKRVAEISKARKDPETAHGKEDDLFVDVLRAIAEGRAEDPAKCATEALKSVELDFPRWTA